MTTQFADMIGKVRNLLAKADATEFPEEAAAFRQGAEALMFKHKISQASLTAEERATGGGYAAPEWREILLCSRGNSLYSYYSGIALTIVRHVDARTVSISKPDGVYLRVVGFAADLDYLEMLLASAVLAFGKRMEPAVHSDESEASNAFRLRMGGMERHRIAAALWGYPKDEHGNQVPMTDNVFKGRNRRVTNLIKKGAAEAGEDPAVVLGRGNNIKTFRESYAGGFYYTLTNRLRNLALNRGETDKGLVLASLERQVEEMFYGEYPHLRPEESGRAEYVAPNADCTKCKKAKSGYCQEHGYLRPRKGSSRAAAWNHEASNLGSAAARTVDLGPGGTPKAPSAPTRTELG